MKEEYCIPNIFNNIISNIISLKEGINFCLICRAEKYYGCYRPAVDLAAGNF